MVDVKDTNDMLDAPLGRSVLPFLFAVAFIIFTFLNPMCEVFWGLWYETLAEMRDLNLLDERQCFDLRIDLFTPMCMEGRCDIFVPGTSAVAWVDKTHINLILDFWWEHGSSDQGLHVIPFLVDWDRLRLDSLSATLTLNSFSLHLRNGCHYLAPFICSGMRSLGYIWNIRIGKAVILEHALELWKTDLVLNLHGLIWLESESLEYSAMCSFT